MAEISSTQKQGKNNSARGQLVAKVYYEADDGSAKLIYSVKCPAPVSDSRRSLHWTALGVYHDMTEPLTILRDGAELNITKVSMHEVFYDEFGDVEADYLLEGFGL